MKINILILIFIFLIKNSIESSIRHQNSPKCGIRKFDKNIMNSRFGEFPWTVLMKYKKKCSDRSADLIHSGGSLIHPKIVLTGPLLLALEDFEDKIVVEVGVWNRSDSDEQPIQERSISQVYLHPNFTYLTKHLRDYNFALLELDSPVELNYHVNTICLPPSGYETMRQDCIASGFGATEHSDLSVKIMKSIPEQIVSYSECQLAIAMFDEELLAFPNQLKHSFICSGGKGIATCSGDGGGPIVCPIDNADDRYSQIGIVGFGTSENECDGQYPGMNAKVAIARNWIDSKFDELGLDKGYYSYSN